MDALGDGDSPAPARLLANLAVEQVYVGSHEHNRRLSDEALAIARRLGDPETLAWVLSLRFNTIRGDPGTLPERLANTAELIAVARELDDPALTAIAFGWRFFGAMEAGDIDEANRCFDRFDEGVTGLRQPTLWWYVTYCKAGRMLFFGRLDEAERLSREALALGTSGGQPDAQLFFDGQSFQLAFERGMLSSREAHLRAAVEANPKSQGRRSFLALLYYETERRREARSVFEDLAVDDFTGLTFLPA